MPVITEMTSVRVPVNTEMIAVRATSYNSDDCKVMPVITDLTSKRGVSYLRDDCRERCQLLLK